MHELNASSGSAAINIKDDIFILDDTAQGIGLYKLSSCERIKTFEVPMKVGRRSRTVAFHDQNTAVISGSDHGRVYIYERRLGTVRDTLYTGHDDWVQSIAVSYKPSKKDTNRLTFIQAFDNEGTASIVIGRSGENIRGSNPLQVWVKKDPVLRAVPTARSNKFEKLWIAISVILATLFVVENILVRTLNSSRV